MEAMKTRPCHHTLQLTNQRGQPHGTWSKQGNRIVCGRCGRFYGRLQKVTDKKERKKQEKKS